MSFPWRLDDRVALITGGSAGIGEATVRLFVEAGAKVGILGRSADEVNQLARELGGEEAGVLPLVADVADEKAMRSAVAKLVDQWQRIDVVVANAGVNGAWAPIDELSSDEWNETLGVNLTGAFLSLKLAVPHLKRTRGCGVIIASVNGTRIFSNSGATAYSCSKAGQVALAKMAALELARHGVRVNVVCPGFIDTEIHEKTERRNLDDVTPEVEYPEGVVPLTGGKPGSPLDVARLILFLSGDAARHITGTEVWIDGGESLLKG